MTAPILIQVQTRLRARARTRVLAVEARRLEEMAERLKGVMQARAALVVRLRYARANPV